MIKKRKRRKKDLRLSLPHFDINENVKRDLWGVLIITTSIILCLSFVDLAGSVGYYLRNVLRWLFGEVYFLFPFWLFILGVKIIDSNRVDGGRVYYMRTLSMIFVVILIFCHINIPLEEMFVVVRNSGGGGVIGAVLAWCMVSLLGKWGGIVVSIALLIIIMIFTFKFSLAQVISFFKIPKLTNKVLDEKSILQDNSIAVDGNEVDGGQNKNSKWSTLLSKLSVPKKRSASVAVSEDFTVKSIKNKKQASSSSVVNSSEKLTDSESRKKEVLVGGGDLISANKISQDKSTILNNKHFNWNLPSLDLLDTNDSEPTSGNIQVNKNIIQRTLANFGIRVVMGEVHIGPTVTQYTLKPLEGVKLSRITALQSDLALALAAKAIRIEAPIPGQSWVGIEMPNESVAMVTLKSILQSEEFKLRKSNLSMILGRDVAGNSVIANIAKMPHLMIAGSTGSGKTVCVNTLISGLLFQNSPQELRFIMIDPKRVELTPYNDIPHLLNPVIVEPDKAINALKWAVKEMENRYDMLSRFGCRNIESYNQLVASKHPEQDPLYYILIIIDEMADLMATHGREMEATVVRLAQMARAIGIHLVLSTQRPSVEVITGLIKANITTRIAFLVASQIDSRTILDAAGADKLLGNGDMLYQSGDTNHPKRIQGVFISEEEVRRLVDYIKNQKSEEVDYNQSIVESSNFSTDPMGANSEVDDELYGEALEIIKDAGKASASLLQRRLKVGYARAARLLDLMEDNGIIGPAQGAKPREVYLNNYTDDSMNNVGGANEGD